MALTLTELQALRDEAVKRAGIVRQQFGDRSIEYAEINKTIAFYDSEIAKAPGAAKRLRRTVIVTSKGW